MLAGAHHLDCAQQRRALPVAFRTKAVALFHQALHRQTRQLGQAVQVFKGGGECLEIAFVEKGLDADFDTSGVNQMLAFFRLASRCARSAGIGFRTRRPVRRSVRW